MIDTVTNSSEFRHVVHEQTSLDSRITNWQADLSRLIRRSKIYQQLGSNLPLDEIKAVVREHERDLGVDRLIDNLVTSEFVVSPKVVALTEELHDKLKGFEFVECIVLHGSAVNGGGVIRNVMSGADSHDLDWGIIYKGEHGPSDDELKKLMTKANRVIPRLAKKYGLAPDFRSCHGEKAVNPAEGCYMPKIKDLEHAKYMWRHFNGGSANVKDLMMYFQPSFPPNSNIENRKLLLEALSLFSEDTLFFNRVIERFLNDWSGFHIIKDKHLEGADTDSRLSALKNKVVKDSGFVMRAAMEVLLRETSSGAIFSRPTTYLA